MTTATRETPTSRAHAQEPSEWCGRSKHILLSQRGWKARKIPAMGSIFLLTFPFIEEGYRRSGIFAQPSGGASPVSPLYVHKGTGHPKGNPPRQGACFTCFK